MATDEVRQPLSQEITSSIANVWKRYTQVRPTGGTTEVNGNVVRCMIPGSARSFEAAVVEPADGVDADRLRSYRRDAAAAVAKSTRCRVVGMISERDTDSDLAREIFVLDTAPKQARFGDPGWIVS